MSIVRLATQNLGGTLCAVPVIAAGLIAASAWQPAHADPLFVTGSTFQVQATGSPDSFTDTVSLTPGVAQSLDNGALSLTISIVPGGAGQSEWLVFNYQTTNGAPLSPTGGNWSINQVGLDAAVPVLFNSDFTAFFDGSTNLPGTSSVFGGPVVASPVPGETAIMGGLGTGFMSPFAAGPLVSLGAFIDPFDQLDGRGVPSANVTGFEQALEFLPQTPIPTPEPASFALLGSALLGLGAIHRSRRM